MVTKKAGDKSGAKKGGAASSKKSARKSRAKRKPGDELDGFTAGAENENIRRPGEEDDDRIEVTSEEVGGTGGKRGGGKRSRRAEQPDLIPDMRIEELHTAALNYVADRDARIELSTKEKRSKEFLIAAMKKHMKDAYSADGVTVKLVHEKENIKVTVNGDGGDGDD